jgi:hypothetical protein
MKVRLCDVLLGCERLSGGSIPDYFFATGSLETSRKPMSMPSSWK